jgi:hypothetical protein
MLRPPAMLQCLAVTCLAGIVATVASTCNATLKQGYSVGGNAYKQLKGADSAACCAACVADARCAGFVTSASDGGECLLKADLHNLHAKATNNCGAVRGTLGPPGPGPAPKPGPPPPPPTPPPAGSPIWELVSVEPLPVIGSKHPDVVSASILTGFETGQYQRINDTFYYTANELGMCAGVVWDLVTRAALWSAPNSTVRFFPRLRSSCKSVGVAPFVSWGLCEMAGAVEAYSHAAQRLAHRDSLPEEEVRHAL